MAGKKKTTMKSHRVGADRLGEAVNGTISDRATQWAGGCEVCLMPTRAKRGAKKRFCSDRCRLLSWAVDTLAKALKEGRAEGLTEKIRALASLGRMAEIDAAKDQEEVEIIDPGVSQG